MSPRVVLVGPPGAGKTTVAGLLAQRLGLGVRDTDLDVEAATGSSVSDVFVDHGEAHFRALEHEAVLRAVDEHAGVLALGGGAVLDARSREALRDSHVVFLDVGLADAAARVGLSAARPVLMGNVRGRLKTLLDERRPLYLAVADAVVGTDGRTAGEVAAAVLATLPAAVTGEHDGGR